MSNFSCIEILNTFIYKEKFLFISELMEYRKLKMMIAQKLFKQTAKTFTYLQIITQNKVSQMNYKNCVG